MTRSTVDGDRAPRRTRRGCFLFVGAALLTLAVATGALLLDLRRATRVVSFASAPRQAVGEVVAAPPAEAPAQAEEGAAAPGDGEAPPVAEVEAPPPRWAEYEAPGPKTVIELQPFRRTTTIAVEDGAGNPGRATLIDLHPRVGSWYLLRIEGLAGQPPAEFHLQNPRPDRQTVTLDERYLFGPILEDPEGRVACDLWSRPSAGLFAAATRPSPLVPLCADRLLLRNPTQGRKTAMEWTTDLLRDNVWEGEALTVFVRRTVYQDAFRVTSEVLSASGNGPGAGSRGPAGAPAAPLVDPAAVGHSLVPVDLGLTLDLGDEAPGKLLVGRWYPVRGREGVYLSAFQARLAAPEIAAQQRGQVNPLDEIESSALVYMVAFDLERFRVGFSMGTDHPRIGWSERVPEAMRSATMPGPDGFGTLAPLVTVGMVPREVAKRTVATFTGGFKRSHGAFRAGALANVNAGSHYGFMEAGVVLSKLQPGLATFVATTDGEIGLETWSAEDTADLEHVADARQNGPPLLEADPVTGEPRVGRLVPRWTEGNWSGSQDQRLRTLRAGLCLQEEGDRRFLLYGYFSTATPSAMARVFQAYRCDYAMMTDMNALEHTYLAVYPPADSGTVVEHLIDEMRVLDREEEGRVARRFLDFPDNRDYFYVTRRDEP